MFFFDAYKMNLQAPEYECQGFLAASFLWFGQRCLDVASATLQAKSSGSFLVRCRRAAAGVPQGCNTRGVGLAPRVRSRCSCRWECVQREHTLVPALRWTLYPELPYLPLQPTGRRLGLWL